MATVLESFDTPMLDYHTDTDVQMQTSAEPWFQDEAIMEEENHFSRESSNGDLVDVEVEMENYEDDESQNPEYEMVDETPVEYSAVSEVEDVIVTDASHHPFTAADSALESLAVPIQPDTLPQSELSALADPGASYVAPLPTEAEVVASEIPIPEAPSEPLDVAHLHTEGPDATVDLSVSTHDASEAAEIVAKVLPVQAATSESSAATHVPDDSSSHAEENVLVHVTIDGSISGPSHSTEGDDAESFEAVEPSVQDDVASLTALHTSDSSAANEEVEAEQAAITYSTVVDGGPVESGQIFTAVEQQQQENVEPEPDPHEISDGVYIDPPPAVLLSFAFLEHTDVCLFNQPSHSDPSSSTTELPSYDVLLSDRPTLYYEPLTSVFDSLRNDSDLSSITDLSHVELMLDAHDLQLTISEDNIFARETSLHDLNVLHDGSDLSGPLRLRLQLINPRFIVRYRMLQDQISRLNLAVDGEEYAVEELNDGALQETTEQEHGPDFDEETPEEYIQEQDGQTTADNVQIEQPTENYDPQPQLDNTIPGYSERNNDTTEPDSENVPQEAEDETEAPEDGEDAEAVGSYDDTQDVHETLETVSEDPVAPSVSEENAANEESSAVHGELHDVPDEGEDAEIAKVLEAEGTQGESHEQEYDEAAGPDSDSLAVPEPITEPNTQISAEPEESYEGDDLYYDGSEENWEDNAYEEGGEEGAEAGADTTFETEPEVENETASVESSVTLSSRNSKRSIHDVDEEEITEAAASAHSSPGSKRPRTE